MTTHILNFGYTTGQSLTAKLFTIGSDTVAATASSVAEATNRQGRYAAAFEDVDAGDYLLVYFLDGSAAGSEFYTIAGTDGESVRPWSEQGPKAQASAVLAAAAVSPIAAEVKSVDEAAGVATEESVLAVLGAISSEAMRVPSPNVDGALVLVAGDTYDGIGQPKAGWSVSTDYTDGWDVMLTIRDESDAVVLEAPGEVPSASLVQVPLVGPRGLEFKGCPGRWQGKFDVQVSKGESRRTIAVGKCYVTEDQTR